MANFQRSASFKARIAGVTLGLCLSLAFEGVAMADGEKAPDSQPTQQQAQPPVLPPAAQQSEQPPAVKTGEGGSAATATEAATPPAPPKPSGPPEYHIARMRLSGSLCIACLKTLEEKLRKMPGVPKLKVAKVPFNIINPYSPELTTWANGTIIYDARQMPLDDLKAAIKLNGYHAYKIVDELFGRPVESVNEDKL